MRITHHGQPLRYHAITAGLVKVIASMPLAPRRRPVKPKPTHLWHRRFLPDCHKPAQTPITKPDISTLGERGHFEATPDFMDTELRYTRGFKLHRTDIAQV